MVAVNARMIKQLLMKKHAKDICVPECKTGASWSGNPFIIDFWATKKSWSKPVTVAYEIKVNRQDFLRDEKWQNYLPYCTDFYFAAPQGIIDPKELPEFVGLIITSKNAKRLFTKRKCIHRSEVQIPVDIYRYILMWRVSTIDPEYRKKSKSDYWSDWMQKKNLHNDLGGRVSKKIKEVVDRVNSENRQLKRENERLSEIKKIMIAAGFSEKEIFEYRFKFQLEQRLKEINSGIPHGLSIKLKHAIESLQKAMDEINK